MLDHFLSNRKKKFSFLLLAMLVRLGSADFRGTIEMSNTEIEAEDVTYTFDLRF